ncbi:MAG: ester cyclase [Pseudonocardiales bacterium]|nr:ester cyclase [Pseudonocardiales bacterium]
MTTTETLRETREALVREHMESENRHEFDVTIATFEHPRYELIASGEVFDGQEEVAEYFARTRGAFPDQRNEIISMRHADDAVIVELNLLGTHLGELYGIPATGLSFSCRMLAMFLFEDDRLVCERVYFNVATIMSQLGLFGGAQAADPGA